ASPNRSLSFWRISVPGRRRCCADYRTGTRFFRTISDGSAAAPAAASGKGIVTSIFLQVVASHAWPRTAIWAGAVPERRILATNRACPSKPQLYQRSSGLEKSLGGD